MAVAVGPSSNLFSGTGVPAAILVFRRDKADGMTIFIDASREFQDGKNQNRLRPDDIVKITRTCRERRAGERYAHLATSDEIRANNFDLDIPRYVDTFETTLAAAKTKLRGYRDELGLS